ncbi:precorrin-6A synthase (deacetylating) [Marinobacter bryozoorum]|uniref:precorrin-6A synthase (deacetylating) n=1 Tax=Marinobacter bryozoorum TaxID=256324 RepID=UPI002005DD82|nr:precorrin-6A synthase (deacetylating) [Marinobacter bryozoorum]MCK7545858.1 precorrin-6A synthase (deacetylating) [Marinobacter bryozoorum]
MIQLSLIGIGTGNPDHVTLAAINALNHADLILLPRKGDAKSDLIDLRRLLCRKLLSEKSSAEIVEFDLPARREDHQYLEAVADWHTRIAEIWGELIQQHLPDGGRVGLMIWGDPSLYDSSLRIASRLSDKGKAVQVKVVPGITSLQVLTAEHCIPLNTIAEPVHITTGRRLRENGWPTQTSAMAVMLDSGGAFQTLPQDNIYIWWGAYLGMDKQCLINGPLKAVGQEIMTRRDRLKAEHGWIMDTYLMKIVAD